MFLYKTLNIRYHRLTEAEICSALKGWKLQVFIIWNLFGIRQQNVHILPILQMKLLNQTEASIVSYRWLSGFPCHICVLLIILIHVAIYDFQSNVALSISSSAANLAALFIFLLRFQINNVLVASLSRFNFVLNFKLLWDKMLL